MPSFSTMVPTVVSSNPARAGPTMRERLNCMERSAMPAPIWCFSTINGTMVLKEGIDSASVTPTISEQAMMTQGSTLENSSSPTSSRGQSIWIDWLMKITLRRSARSASWPPSNVRAHIGASMAKASRPSMKEESVRLSISQGCATCCTQVPRLASRFETQKVP